MGRGGNSSAEQPAPPAVAQGGTLEELVTNIGQYAGKTDSALHLTLAQYQKKDIPLWHTLDAEFHTCYDVLSDLVALVRGAEQLPAGKWEKFRAQYRVKRKVLDEELRDSNAVLAKLSADTEREAAREVVTRFYGWVRHTANVLDQTKEHIVEPAGADAVPMYRRLLKYGIWVGVGLLGFILYRMYKKHGTKTTLSPIAAQSPPITPTEAPPLPVACHPPSRLRYAFTYPSIIAVLVGLLECAEYVQQRWERDLRAEVRSAYDQRLREIDEAQRRLERLTVDPALPPDAQRGIREQQQLLATLRHQLVPYAALGAEAPTRGVER